MKARRAEGEARTRCSQPFVATFLGSPATWGMSPDSFRAAAISAAGTPCSSAARVMASKVSWRCLSKSRAAATSSLAARIRSNSCTALSFHWPLQCGLLSSVNSFVRQAGQLERGQRAGRCFRHIMGGLLRHSFRRDSPSFGIRWCHASLFPLIPSQALASWWINEWESDAPVFPSRRRIKDGMRR